MRALNLLGMAGFVLSCAAAAFAQGQPAPAVELKVGDTAPNFKLQERRQDLQPLRLPGQRRRSSSPGSPAFTKAAPSSARTWR
jgi:hypothetical protein